MLEMVNLRVSANLRLFGPAVHRTLDFSIAHISREQNLEANELANRAAVGRKSA